VAGAALKMSYFNDCKDLHPDVSIFAIKIVIGREGFLEPKVSYSSVFVKSSKIDNFGMFGGREHTLLGPTLLTELYKHVSILSPFLKT
jgi:hypothetical protein